jgi:hypothetical protein
MFKEINNKILFYSSCLLAAYFGFLILDAFVLRLTFVLVGVFREILTIPALILLPIMLVIVIIRMRKEKFQLNSYLFWSFTMLVTTGVGMFLTTVFDSTYTA